MLSDISIVNYNIFLNKHKDIRAQFLTTNRPIFRNQEMKIDRQKLLRNIIQFIKPNQELSAA